MSKILIEGKPAVGLDTHATSGHLYLVYQDDSGEEKVVRGGPRGFSLIPPTLFGSLVLQRDISLVDSRDARRD